MDIFEFDDYRKVIRERISELPRAGFGQLGRLAEHLGVAASFVSQMLAEKKNLSEDQAYTSAEFLEFTEPETAFFLLLVLRERASHHKLKNFYTKQIEDRKRAALHVKGRVKVERELTFEEQAVFYSDFIYTAVHTLVSIPSLRTADALAAHLKISRALVVEVAQWLIEHGLCKGTLSALETGASSTYVERESPLALRHHANWRSRGLETMRNRSENDLFFTAPFSISERDFQVIRKDIGLLIEKIARKVEGSESELMATINVDLFRT